MLCLAIGYSQDVNWTNDSLNILGIGEKVPPVPFGIEVALLKCLSSNIKINN